jgi:flagellar M-ring protein FliF
VAPLIPKRISGDLKALIHVTQFPSLPSEPLPQPTMTDQMMDWLSTNWSTLGMCVLGLIGLVMLRSMVRSMPAAETAAPAPIGLNLAAAGPVSIAEETPAEEPQPGDATPARRKRKLKSGPTLRDDLVEMVREDPDAAANVLKSWIGSTT